jgi:membrane associated rhomboid family serine protease
MAAGRSPDTPAAADDARAFQRPGTMGFNDRDYSRDDGPGFRLRAPSSAIGLLIVANLVLFVIDAFTGVQEAEGFTRHPLSEAMGLKADLFRRPWQCWQLLTYGFFHDPKTIWHLIGNMLMLWMFGMDLEAMYGKREFLRIYFAAQIVGGLAWAASQQLFSQSTGAYMIGASGAVTGIFTIFVFHYPRRILLFWGVIPVPVWLFGLVWLIQDISGFRQSIGGRREEVAFAAHLGGALVGALYYRFSWNFGRWLPESVALPKLGRGGFGRRPKLRVHQPPADDAPRSLDAEVDRLLAKITDTGYDSLSDDEKKTLERASSRYQRRRK